MKSPNASLILLLAATTIGGAVLAWNQYAELVELRAAAMNKDERSDLQKRIWDLEKLNRELDDRLAASRSTGFGEPTEALAETTSDDGRGKGDRNRFGKGERGRGGPPGGGGREFTAMRELMSKPEVQALMSVQQKAAVEARYGALFKSLNLSPDQLEKFKSALAERQTTLQDIMGAARDQGMDPRTDPEGYRKLMASAQEDFSNNLKSVLGDAGYAQYQNFEQTMPQRNVVNQLQQRLNYTDAPLSPAQVDQMVQILAANASASRRSVQTGSTTTTYVTETGGGGPPGAGIRLGADIGNMILGGLTGGGGGPTSAITSTAVTQAQTVLTAPQLAALQQLQQQQQAAQQLQQIMRDTMGNAQGNATKAAPAPAPTKPRG